MYKTATFLVEHFWGQPRGMADGLGVLLLTWNQAFYRYGVFDFEELENVLMINLPILDDFRVRDIQSLAAVDEPIIEQLFLDFLFALRIKEGKKADCQSPVATAKALHLLAPSFLPVWDQWIADAYGCYYGRQPEKRYVAFANKMKALQEQLRGCVPDKCGRTFLKLIDEYNYAKYTGNWV